MTNVGDDSGHNFGGHSFSSSALRQRSCGALPRLRGRPGRDPWRGAAFTRTLFARTFLNPASIRWVRASRRLPRTSPDVPTNTAIQFVSYQCNAIRPNRIVGRFREPPARQLLRNKTVVCAISLVDGQRLKAAPLLWGLSSYCECISWNSFVRAT